LRVLLKKKRIESAPTADERFFIAVFPSLKSNVIRLIVYPVGALLVSAQGKHKACPYKLEPTMRNAFSIICLEMEVRKKVIFTQ